jgi:hypothetical protein
MQDKKCDNGSWIVQPCKPLPINTCEVLCKGGQLPLRRGDHSDLSYPMDGSHKYVPIKLSGFNDNIHQNEDLNVLKQIMSSFIN